MTDRTSLVKAGAPYTGHRRINVLENTIDYSANNAGASDTDRYITIPAGSYVIGLVAIVDTLEGGTMTFEVGDSDAATTFLTGANGNSGTYKMGDGGDGTTVTTTVSKLYDAADYILVTVNNAADTMKLTIRLMVVDIAA